MNKQKLKKDMKKQIWKRMERKNRNKGKGIFDSYEKYKYPIAKIYLFTPKKVYVSK